MEYGHFIKRQLWWYVPIAVFVPLDEGLEWESFAQLPHGVEQIKEHILTQDNVPLLVHIYTHA